MTYSYTHTHLLKKFNWNTSHTQQQHQNQPTPNQPTTTYKCDVRIATRLLRLRVCETGTSSREVGGKEDAEEGIGRKQWDLHFFITCVRHMRYVWAIVMVH